MKYVQPNTTLDNFFINSGMNSFQPFEVTEKIIDEFLSIITQQSQIPKEINNLGFMNRGYSSYF